MVEATAVPSIASVRFRPQMAIEFAGLGERLSGTYRIVEVNQVIDPSTTFKTTLKVRRREFRPTPAAAERIAAAADTAAAGTEGSASGAPEPTTAEESTRYRIDPVRGTTRRVTGTSGTTT